MYNKTSFQTVNLNLENWHMRNSGGTESHTMARLHPNHLSPTWEFWKRLTNILKRNKLKGYPHFFRQNMDWPEEKTPFNFLIQ